MKDEIPKAIKAEFTIASDSIKYPTYLDDEFQKSISEEENLNNYTKENIKKSFDDFFQIFQSCKDKVYDIISNNLHNFQDYCRNINIKSINYVFYFNIFEKFAKLLVDKYYNNPIKQKTEIFTDEIIYDVIHKNKNFSFLYKKDYKDEKNGVNKINQILNPILEKYNKIMRSKNKIGNIIVRTFKYLIKYLFVPFEQELLKFQKIEVFFENNYFKTNNNEENAITILNIIIYLNKIRVLEYAFHNCALVKPDDICNLEETSKEWLELKKILFRLIPEKPEELKRPKDTNIEEKEKEKEKEVNDDDDLVQEKPEDDDEQINEINSEINNNDNNNFFKSKEESIDNSSLNKKKIKESETLKDSYCDLIVKNLDDYRNIRDSKKS